MNKVLLLIAMLYCHIVDDYYLQGWLASAKQRKWWEEHAQDDIYRHDYIMALHEHAFSWTVTIHIPAVVYRLYLGNMIDMPSFLILFTIMWLIHAMVDHLKANLHTINLVQDQLCHVLQVLAVWACYAFN